MHSEYTGGLVGKGKARQSFAISYNVERARKTHDSHLLFSELLLDAQVEIAVIDAREVACATRRYILRRQSKTEYVNKCIGDVTMRLVVEVERAVNKRVKTGDARKVEVVVATLVALTADRKDELNRGMVEIELNTQLAVVGLARQPP